MDLGTLNVRAEKIGMRINKKKTQLLILSPCLVMSVRKHDPSYTTLFQDKRSLRYAHTYTQSIDLT